MRGYAPKRAATQRAAPPSPSLAFPWISPSREDAGQRSRCSQTAFDFSAIEIHARSHSIQPKLKVGGTGDTAERLADGAAAHVMRMPEPCGPGWRENNAVSEAAPQSNAAHSKIDLEARGNERAGLEAPPVVQEVLTSAGRPLDRESRVFFERRFGGDLSHIRVHADGKAADSADAIGARAYTSGRDIVFADGEYAPSSESGKRLIAHELAHTRQQQGAGPRVQRAPNTSGSGGTVYTAATSFTELISLIRTAETKLKANGQDVTTRLKTLRGLFYGTTWSMDFDNEHSAMRNLGFAYFLYGNPAIRTAGNLYALGTGQYDKAKPDPAFVPMDPTTILGASLLKALKDSAEVTNPTDNRKVDVGHLLIGMEARIPKGGQEKAQLSDPRPTSSSPMGGTGLELTTWVGDLGGGTAQVAQLRVASPSTTTPAKHAFTGSPHDYGAEVNLEGDVAAFLVGLSPSAGDPYSIALDETKGVAGAMETYVSPSGAGAEWRGRAKRFLGFYGAAFDASNALTNRPVVVATFTDHIKKFALYYKETRMKDELMKKVGSSPTQAQLSKIDSDMKAIEAAIPKAAGEVAGLFADALMAAVKDPSKGIVPP